MGQSCCSGGRGRHRPGATPEPTTAALSSTPDGGRPPSTLADSTETEIAEDVGPTTADGLRSVRAVRDHAVVRWYVVWRVNGSRTEVRGIHRGTIQAWRDLERAFPAKRYLPGYSLRRFNSEQEAIDAYYMEAVRHQSPMPPNYYVHE